MDLSLSMVYNYHTPRARVRTNNWVSGPFNLYRGTRQGCPLSPSLFALALDPLAIAIRGASDVWGLRVGMMEERLSLYADDALLYLNEDGPSLQAALCIFDHFGGLSGVKINWTKSVIFPLDGGGTSGPHTSPLKMVREFKYLGIVITRHPSEFIAKNLTPVIHTLRTKCSAWGNLQLNLLGRINLL